MTVDILLTVGAAFGASLISGLGGFGGGFLIVIAMTPIVGAKSVIPLLSVFAICANISRVVIYWRTVAWRHAFQFILASLPGVFLGTRFLAEISETFFLGFMGTILILAAPARRYLKKRSFEPGLKTMLSLGFLFGFMSGTAAGSGMLVIAFFNSIGLHGPLLLGTDAVIGLANAVSRAGAFLQLGLLDQRLIVLGVLMGIVTFPGTWIASRIVHRMGTRIHSQLIEILIVGAGLVFIFKAVQASLNL